jgi:NAD(P)-dependent dehydrogenase (short-subunit alcohol dehydrogenase family)
MNTAVFRNKVALITGGSSGIGRATAVKLAEYGAKVCICARHQEGLDKVVVAAKGLPGEMMAVTADVTSQGDCRLAVEQTVARFGRLDILVSSAGLSMRTFFEGSDLAAMERVMRVNFFGTLYATHYALPHIKQSRGSMVGLSSLTGLRGVPSYAVYGASKFAIEGFYEALRLELKPEGVHVGVFAPGFVNTPLREKVLGRDGKPWPTPPDPPFRIWCVEQCADIILKIIARRRAHISLPWYMGVLLWLDHIVGCTIGNAILRWAFPKL